MLPEKYNFNDYITYKINISTNSTKLQIKVLLIHFSQVTIYIIKGNKTMEFKSRGNWDIYTYKYKYHSKIYFIKRNYISF